MWNHEKSLDKSLGSHWEIIGKWKSGTSINGKIIGKPRRKMEKPLGNHGKLPLDHSFSTTIKWNMGMSKP